ncbi:glycerol-3-phosphate 1-O-acyltransferase PlsY [Alkalihalobacillus sp. 1P02AB]|uniref:glycerol-3-phosphate 1-O-acyltransferase PlsY n=1 Tax=Alkalihalobacillus sp. 1P02AB TaxID=3132260 RepID=UPI0039A41E58
MEGILLVVTIVFGYLVGSISFSYIIAKKIKKVDIRQHGSGNAGATNTLRVLGVGPAIAVLILDVLKGIIAVWFGYMVATNDLGWFPVLGGVAAIIGHNWPAYYNFKGGKGVATTIGVLSTLVFWPSLIAGLIAILSIIFTRYVSLGSLLFVLLTPVATFFLLPYYEYPIVFIYLTFVVALLSIWRHRTNVLRIFNGSENKIGQKS